MPRLHDDCARDLLDLIPALMQEIRFGMRGARSAGITVPQFRTLAMVAYIPGASLSDAAAHVGLGLPAMSVLVDGLVRRALVTRCSAPGDRRRVVIELTADGRKLLADARRATRRLLAARLATLAEPDVARVMAALHLLTGIFGSESAPTLDHQPRKSLKRTPVVEKAIA